MTVNRWRKVGVAVAKFIVVLLTTIALLLTFFLLQSKLSGTEPAIFGHKIYIVMSGSMVPAIEVGSVVVVQPLSAAEVLPGDIITFRSDNSRSVTTHRVHHLETETGLLFYTKGDANEVLDPLPVPAQQLVGKVVLTVPYLGYLFAYTRTREGLMVLLGLAVFILTGELVRTHLAEKKERQRKGSNNEEVMAKSTTDNPKGV